MSGYGPSAQGAGEGLVLIIALGSCETIVVKTGENVGFFGWRCEGLGFGCRESVMDFLRFGKGSKQQNDDVGKQDGTGV